MKKINIIYWISNGLLMALMLSSAIPGVMGTADSQAFVVTHLHYPTYFGALLGAAKILGVIALIIPGYPTIKEWAYAGFAFDLMFALSSFIPVGDPFKGWAPFIVFFALFIISYTYYRKRITAKAAGIS
ncbi:DoxX family protein [Mucilaginibacter xinganensis]|uniref:DoxX-like family protein n=1 Tax=Mucilaginibacter xinganensis TaxID=1234841 RepID=A0A223NW03_9SPHI|nr:DoxX family protein [Mucilaginibacter xinganensis]ASU34006.1 hypothetical protein MuYL_2116 [Mucilaginibacter xinganensis]